MAKKVKTNEEEIVGEAVGEVTLEEAWGVVSEEEVSKPYFVSDTNIRLLNACVESDEPVLLIGETGTGKTTLIREMAKEKEKTLIRISVNGSMGVEEILGKWLVNKGTTVWQDGILTAALRSGHWVVMDEINAALPEILFTLHSLLDDDRKIVLPEKDNEIVYPAEGFRFFGTMNPPEEYAGTKDMNKALMSRFTAVLYIDVLSNTDEIRLLQDKGTDFETATKLVLLATKLREYKKKDDIFYFCSTRDLVQTAHLILCGVSLTDAAVGSIVNKMTPKEFEVVKSDFEKIIGSILSLPVKTIQELLDLVAGFDAKIDALKLDHDAKISQMEDEIRSLSSRSGSIVHDDFINRIKELAKD